MAIQRNIEGNFSAHIGDENERTAAFFRTATAGQVLDLKPQPKPLEQVPSADNPMIEVFSEGRPPAITSLTEYMETSNGQTLRERAAREAAAKRAQERGRLTQVRQTLRELIPV